MQYHIARNGQQAGVFSEEEIRQKLQTGEFQPTDLCWTESMPEWQSLATRILYAASPAVPAVANPYAPPVSQIGARGGPLVVAAPLASIWQRLGAAFVEAGIALVLAIPLGIGVFMMEAAEKGGETTPPMIAIILMAISGVAFLALIIYNLVLLTKKGQSIGKKLLDIRIATVEDNSNPGFVKCILLRGLVNGIIGSIPVVGPFYSLVDICFIFREDRRCIHDLIAGTHVVQGSLPEQ